MSDIAKRAGVSSSTVSFVLNDRHEAARISETTRQKVLDVAREMGYRTNQSARAMRTGNTRMIGIVGGNLASEHVGAMVAGALEEIEKRNYTLKILPLTDEDALDAVFKRSSELRLQGAIGLHLSARAVEAFEAEARRYEYPLLLLDTHGPRGILPEVASDDEAGIGAAIAHLTQLGHRRIGLISGDAHDVIVPVRQAAFSMALKEQSLEVLPHYLQYGDFSQREPSVQAARALLSLPASERPTAILCMGDLIAMAALQVASALKIEVPRDLSLIGFADFAPAEFANPPLTTVRQDFSAMGRVAAQQILQRCEAKAHDEAASEGASDGSLCHQVPTQLIVRETCGPAPK